MDFLALNINWDKIQMSGYMLRQSFQSASKYLCECYSLCDYMSERLLVKLTEQEDLHMYNSFYSHTIMHLTLDKAVTWLIGGKF